MVKYEDAHLSSPPSHPRHWAQRKFLQIVLCAAQKVIGRRMDRKICIKETSHRREYQRCRAPCISPEESQSRTIKLKKVSHGRTCAVRSQSKDLRAQFSHRRLCPNTISEPFSITRLKFQTPSPTTARLLPLILLRGFCPRSTRQLLTNYIIHSLMCLVVIV